MDLNRTRVTKSPGHNWRRKVTVTVGSRFIDVHFLLPLKYKSWIQRSKFLIRWYQPFSLFCLVTEIEIEIEREIETEEVSQLKLSVRYRYLNILFANFFIFNFRANFNFWLKLRWFDITYISYLWFSVFKNLSFLNTLSYRIQCSLGYYCS